MNFEKSSKNILLTTNFLETLSDKELENLSSLIANVQSLRAASQKAADIDSLTGLYNQEALVRLCQNQLSESAESVFSVLMLIDLDNFRELNDTLGLQASDAVLHDFGEVLKRLFRPGDVVGRLENDSFLVFLRDMPGKQIALQKAERILKAAENVLIGVDHAKITASVGIAAAPEHGKSYEELLSVAMNSVKKVKADGKQGICFGEGDAFRPF